MIKIVIIGSGNVATHLIKTFNRSNKVKVIQSFNRKGLSVAGIPATDNYEALETADLYLIAVSDDAISEVSAKLPFKGRLVAHTSGSVALEELSPENRRGVFYPLQSFSRDKDVDFSKIPLCIEAENDRDREILEYVARSISQRVHPVNSEQRRSLHLAAVFVNNFVNHLYAIGDDICRKNDLPFDLLKPLIAETAKKIEHMPPVEAQTGPARRNDQNTLQKHLNQLNLHPTYKKIYELLTKSIQEQQYDSI
ncbi:Rossmann-like and DUF2520 domain-containing protein [Sinomicrobium weinanense]|uniref:DUF2520 domain-containing protein n=1 Tax=Sinomicrobium weinanense TaxID=2842200 RepID=A0A926Q4D8_9FLAO|nr:Rossmann-like and DUF2520 domain-containing protein [Sinomicrobium weinanense]MBC9796976.1 DUF2520 domain-containing protein [Sinomicrobium weinanense]MBU3122185.1 DUF2520 domain-containing protein [Sinomicrobium weinanense]